MKIGIDMDNTICSTDEIISDYETIFLKDNKITIDKLWSDNNYITKFLNKYLEKIYMEAKPKPNVVKIINKLKEQGHEIYIITSRTNSHVTDMHTIITNYCNKNNIKIDGIFINANDKVDICKEKNIDIMIDDSFYIYDRLTTNNISTILFDEYNKYPYIKKRILSWKELSKVSEKFE